jgi:hypothetical protein
MESRNPATLLYIVSATRSGSTVLDLLLGNHPEATSVGELRRLQEHLSEDGPCTCGTSVRGCEFWQGMGQTLGRNGVALEELPTSVPKPRRPLGFLPHAVEVLPIFAGRRWMEATRRRVKSLQEALEAAGSCWLVLDAVAQGTGTRVIVDSSKWSDQFKLLYLLRPEQARAIYLVRDGRGVVCSWLRRVGSPVWKLALSWALNNLRAILLLANVPKDRRLLVRYEDLCRDPEGEMRRICAFAGLPFQEQVLILDKRDRHNIGGSQHRFDKAETRIALDDRWRHSLTSKELAEFNRMVGVLNRILGYPKWPG